MKKSCRRGKIFYHSPKRGQTRGQTELSFGMIFSILLIIVFLVFAFYAIKIFLGFQEKAKAERFFKSLQSDVDTVWNSEFSTQKQQYSVPSYVSFVCFADFSLSAKGANSTIYSELKKAYSGISGSENLIFYPVKPKDFKSKKIDHLDIKKTTTKENPLCIKTNNGKVVIGLNKSSGEALVTITR